ncbi:MAG: iron-sulfur cluster assembly scaffold protein [Patescibacteria group bacterium]|jgi:nitrogen fixation NifU-like protein
MDQKYRDTLVNIYRDPPHKGKLENPTVSARTVGSSCGDIVEMDLKIEDGKITDAKFDGALCIFSTASASFLIQYIIDKSLEEAKKIDVDELIKYMNVYMATSRQHCGDLAIKALRMAIETYENKKD